MTELAYLDAASDADGVLALHGGSDLLDELWTLTMPWAAAQALDATGVPRAFLAQLSGAGDLAVAGCELHRGGLFSFGGATRRLILGVRDGAGELVDLVALSSACEDEWALRLGVADFLGDDWLWRAEMGLLRELRLFSTPMAWLRGGGAGVCVLDWNRSALAALRGLGSVVVSSSSAVDRKNKGSEPQVRKPITLVVEPGCKPRLDAMLAHGGLPLVAEDRQNFRRIAA